MIAGYYNDKYNFMNMAPDADLRNRGFDLTSNEDGLAFYYREDGLRLFK